MMRNKARVRGGARYDDRYFFGNGYFDAEALRLWKIDKGKTLPKNLKYLLEIGNAKDDENVLDLGCGLGQIALHCALGGSKTVAIDSSDSAVRLARQSFEAHRVHVNLLKRKCWDLPFDDSSFDLVYFIAVAWHLNMEDLKKTLMEIRRVLKPGGRLIINSCGNPWTDTFGYPLLWMYKKLRGRPFFWDCKESGHINKMSPILFERTLQHAGFNVELKIGFNPSENNGMIHRLVLATPMKYILCKFIVAVCDLRS